MQDLFTLLVFCLNVCMCTTCVSSTNRGRKRVADPLELELLEAMICVLVIDPGSTAKAASASNH